MFLEVIARLSVRQDFLVCISFSVFLLERSIESWGIAGYHICFDLSYVYCSSSCSMRMQTDEIVKNVGVFSLRYSWSAVLYLPT